MVSLVKKCLIARCRASLSPDVHREHLVYHRAKYVRVQRNLLLVWRCLRQGFVFLLSPNVSIGTEVMWCCLYSILLRLASTHLDDIRHYIVNKILKDLLIESGTPVLIYSFHSFMGQSKNR